MSGTVFTLFPDGRTGRVIAYGVLAYDAPLLAAAPELLSVIEAILADTDERRTLKGCERLLMTHWEALRAVARAARGEAQREFCAAVYPPRASPQGLDPATGETMTVSVRGQHATADAAEAELRRIGVTVADVNFPRVVHATRRDADGNAVEWVTEADMNRPIVVNTYGGVGAARKLIAAGFEPIWGPAGETQGSSFRHFTASAWNVIVCGCDYAGAVDTYLTAAGTEWSRVRDDRPVSEAETAAAFDAWFEAVDAACTRRTGLGVSDMPDYCWRDTFDAGTSPEDALVAFAENQGGLFADCVLGEGRGDG